MSSSTGNPITLPYDVEQQTSEPRPRASSPKCTLFAIKQSIRVVLFGSPLNVFLIFIPLCFVAQSEKWGNVAVFVFGLLSMCSLAERCSFITDELAKHMNELLSGLVYATMNSSLELAVSVSALVNGELRVVQMSLIGSILSDTLLIIGICFACGGFGRRQQSYNKGQANMYIYLMFLSSLGLILPSATTIVRGGKDSKELSRILAFFIIVTYILMCYYELRYMADPSSTTAMPLKAFSARKSKHIRQRQKHLETQKLLSPSSPNSSMTSRATTRHPSIDAHGSNSGIASIELHDLPLGSNDLLTQPYHNSNDVLASLSVQDRVGSKDLLTQPYHNSHDVLASLSVQDSSLEFSENDTELDEPMLPLPLILFWCAVMFVAVTFVAQVIVSTIDEFSAEMNIPLDFVVGIMFAIIGNSAESTSAVQFAVKDSMDYSIHIALGSSVQISMFLYPLNILLGLAIGQPLTFSCSILHAICVLASTLTVAFTLNDGRSNWLKGVILIIIYFFISCTFWFADPMYVP